MSDVKPLTDDEFNWDLVERCIERHAPALAQWFYEQRAALASKEAECERLQEALRALLDHVGSLDEVRGERGLMALSAVARAALESRPSGSAK